MALPDGFVGWLRSQGIERLLNWGRPTPVLTYPSLEENPEVQREREEIGQ